MESTCLKLRDAMVHSTLAHSRGHAATKEMIHTMVWQTGKTGMPAVSVNDRNIASRGSMGSSRLHGRDVDMADSVGPGPHCVCCDI
jgi:hypothetical protein